MPALDVGVTLWGRKHETVDGKLSTSAQVAGSDDGVRYSENARAGLRLVDMQTAILTSIIVIAHESMLIELCT